MRLRARIKDGTGNCKRAQRTRLFGWCNPPYEPPATAVDGDHPDRQAAARGVDQLGFVTDSENDRLGVVVRSAVASVGRTGDAL